MARIFLVSCVAGKKPEPMPAAELYTSPWFTKARRLVEVSKEPWFILSAEHGLLAPDRVIGPYERTLNTMSTHERREWARRVVSEMQDRLPKVDEAVVLAGSKYRENLLPYLRKHFPKVTVPMEGLRIGQQLSWLDHVAAL